MDKHLCKKFMESIYEKALYWVWENSDKETQFLLNSCVLKMNTSYRILEIWTDSSLTAKILGKKRNALLNRMWVVFSAEWQVRVVLDRCYSSKKDEIVLYSSDHLDYLVAAQDLDKIPSCSSR